MGSVPSLDAGDASMHFERRPPGGCAARRRVHPRRVRLRAVRCCSSSRRARTSLLRTRAGDDVTAYRPDDHVWHKGLSLALPNVGPHNFWGGPTYVRGEGYVQLPNNGAQVHGGFVASDTPIAEAAAGLARIDELLDWARSRASTRPDRAPHADGPLRRRRRVGSHVAERAPQRLAEPLAFGSPTSKGRDDAGYAGIFWRGPVGRSRRRHPRPRR